MKPRTNPFRTSQTGALMFRDPLGLRAEDLLQRLRDAGGRGAIIGPMGTGKSTLLRAIASTLAQDCRHVVHVQISREKPFIKRRDRARIGRDAALDAICIDGADLLPRPLWWHARMLGRRAQFFIVTSHARSLLPVLYRTRPTAKLLVDLSRELMSGAAELTEDDGRRLFAEHGGNIREALRALYDLWQHGAFGGAQRTEAESIRPLREQSACSASF